MLCQNCGTNEANVRYTQIINGVKKEIFLCENCSKKLGINNISLNMPIDFSSFLGGILEDYDNEFLGISNNQNKLICNYCNMTYDEFIETGKFGCANCYKTFKPKIDSILTRLNGNKKYLGRKSKEHDIKGTNMQEKKENNDIQQLEIKLKEAIRQECYEDAAKIRDEIKDIKKRGEKNA